MANYLYLSRTDNAWENLAADEYFLDRLGPGDRILYFYVNSPSVIIGKNQNPWTECRLEDMWRDGVRLVRRVTGGGAVYHDPGNLNFSFVASEDLYDRDRQTRLILSAVRAAGISCERSGRNDLLANGRKFSGHAFAARRGVRQHHGTLLVSTDLERLSKYLSPDPRKILSKGISSVRSRVCDLAEIRPGLTPEALRRSLIDAYQKEYGEWREFVPGREELEIIRSYAEKHASSEWLYGAAPKFDYEWDERLSFGSVRLLLSLEKGRVCGVKVYTDSNDPDLPGKFEKALAGTPFSAQAIGAALSAAPAPELREAGSLFLQKGL